MIKFFSCLSLSRMGLTYPYLAFGQFLLLSISKRCLSLFGTPLSFPPVYFCWPSSLVCLMNFILLCDSRACVQLNNYRNHFFRIRRIVSLRFAFISIVFSLFINNLSVSISFFVSYFLYFFRDLTIQSFCVFDVAAEHKNLWLDCRAGLNTNAFVLPRKNVKPLRLQ